MTRHVRSIPMALAIAVLALMSSAAMAQSYTGKWPATVTKSQRNNGKNCITLTDDRSYGFRHSGEAPASNGEIGKGVFNYLGITDIGKRPVRSPFLMWICYSEFLAHAEQEGSPSSGSADAASCAHHHSDRHISSCIIVLHRICL
jgi:hypothetical protein